MPNYNLVFFEGAFFEKAAPSPPEKNFLKKVEAKNEAHLSRLARARGATAYIGLFTRSRTLCVYADISPPYRLLTVIADILRSIFDSDVCYCALGARSADQARRERENFSLNKISIRVPERGLKS